MVNLVSFRCKKCKKIICKTVKTAMVLCPKCKVWNVYKKVAKKNVKKI